MKLSEPSARTSLHSVCLGAVRRPCPGRALAFTSDSNANRIVDKKQSGELWIRRLAWSRSLCHGLHIPAGYATGYWGDIRVPAAPAPMDFSVWFEVYLEDRWWTFDARYNCHRFGRVLMATGPNASDVVMTTSFGRTNLTYFSVVSE
jgi:hypothetical protein